MNTDSKSSILIAFEERYRAYREAIANTIRAFRPGVEVALAEPADLQAEVLRLDPRLVITSGQHAEVGDVPAWVELPTEQNRPASIRVGERRSAAINPGIAELLGVFDEVEDLLRCGSAPQAALVAA